MTIQGEVGVGEITTENFGEILLLDYAAFMCQYAEDRGAAETLKNMAAQLEQRALSRLDTSDGDLQLNLDNLEAYQPILEPAIGATALRSLAGVVEARHGGDRATSPFATQKLIGHQVTISELPQRNADIHRSSGPPRYYNTVSGWIRSVYLGATYSGLELYVGRFKTTWHVGNLVSPRDLAANVTLKFHD